MLNIRSSFAAVVACCLLSGGPACAARTQPVNHKTDPPATARRSATARPGAAHAAALAGKRASQRHSAPVAVAAPPAAAPVAAEADAPQLVSLTGLVFNAQGRPCPGVCVFPTTNTRQIAVTDAQGSFQLQVPAETTLSLQADYVGVGSSRVTVNSSAAQPVHIVLGR